MDWIAANWPLFVIAALVIVLAARLLEELLSHRRRPRHTGEQRIRVIGVGGGGGNAVNEMVESRRPGVSYIAVNTDGQVLERSIADQRIRIGDRSTRGLGAGGNAALGREAAVEDEEGLRVAVQEADLVFVAAGLGGGTGSGAAPLLASYARDAGALTIGVVTMPFSFEGTARRRVAEAALAELRPNVDTLLVIENDRVTDLVAEDTSLADAFGHVNDVLDQTISAAVDIMAKPGLVNLDFADVRSVMAEGGPGLAGIGQASGSDRAAEAARQAIATPLLALDIRGARSVLIHVSGSEKLALREVMRAAEVVREAVDPEADVTFGATFEPKLRDEVRVTVIATRFPETAAVLSPARAGMPALRSARASRKPSKAAPEAATSNVLAPALGGNDTTN
jgi:cell division protein FtsZ